MEKFEGSQPYWHLGFGCLHSFTQVLRQGGRCQGQVPGTLGRGRGTGDRKMSRDSQDLCICLCGCVCILVWEREVLDFSSFSVTLLLPSEACHSKHVGRKPGKMRCFISCASTLLGYNSLKLRRDLLAMRLALPLFRLATELCSNHCLPSACHSTLHTPHTTHHSTAQWSLTCVRLWRWLSFYMFRLMQDRLLSLSTMSVGLSVLWHVSVLQSFTPFLWSDNVSLCGWL